MQIAGFSLAVDPKASSILQGYRAFFADHGLRKLTQTLLKQLMQR